MLERETLFEKHGVVFALLNIRHLYLVTEWEGCLSNPENKSIHVEATLKEALRICEHPLTQIFLKVIDKELSRQD